MANLKDIEREAASERQAFAKSLDDLTSALGPENLKTHAASLIEVYGKDLIDQTWGRAQKNPAALVLVGAGLSLLMAGTGSRPERPLSDGATRPGSGRTPLPEDGLMGFDDRIAAAEAAMKQEEGYTMSNRPTAQWLRDRIEDGLDALPPKARMRVREARQAAITAQEKVEDQARRVAQKSSATMQSQPLAVGAVALGIGALIGALLPSSRREDALMGEHRDRLMSKAKSVLNEEVDRLHETAKSKLAQATGDTSGASHTATAAPTTY